MGKDNEIKKINEAYNTLLSFFIIHLYTTHGLPIEISKEKLSKKSPLENHLIMLKHKDFRKGKYRNK